jgi:hypothetical protein
MAALLKNRPAHGAMAAAQIIARLNHVVAASLIHQANGRPTLVCHWTQDADGRLSCHWDIEPPDIPIPPD